MRQGILLAVLFVAVYYDGWQNRIPNWLCVFSSGLGLILQGYTRGVDGIITSLILGFLVFFPFFLLWGIGIIGAGDVKLIFLGSIFLGEEVLPFLIWGGICTGTLSLILMISRKNFLQRMGRFGSYLEICIRDRRIYSYPFDREKDREEGGIRVSYGLLMGHLLAVSLGCYKG